MSLALQNISQNVCNWISRILHRLWQSAGKLDREQGCYPSMRLLRSRKSRFVRICLSRGVENTDLAIDTASKTITTQTKASSFPSLLRQKRSAIQQVERGDMENTAVIQMTCPECGRQEVKYTAVQLRSADEGSTIFYTCDCGHK